MFPSHCEDHDQQNSPLATSLEALLRFETLHCHAEIVLAMHLGAEVASTGHGTEDDNQVVSKVCFSASI